MQPYDVQIKITLDKIEEISKFIFKKLEPKIDDESSNDMSVLYDNRQKLLDELENLKNNNRFNDFLLAHNEDWNKRLKIINLIEEKNIYLLNAKVTEIGKKIRKLKGQSSLLIYNQGMGK